MNITTLNHKICDGLHEVENLCKLLREEISNTFGGPGELPLQVRSSTLSCPFESFTK